MELANLFLPVQTDRNKQQAKMDQSARLLKLVIQRIELKQKDPSFYVRSLPHHDISCQRWYSLWDVFTWSISRNGNGLGLAWETAAYDLFSLFKVMRRVEKNDNLRQVCTRTIRRICQSFLHAHSSYDFAHSSASGLFKLCLRACGASAPRSKQECVDTSDSDSELAIAYTFHAVLTSVLHLLTSVFQYLIGYVDRGGSKTYSSGAFDFRASFVALVLFQGAYVWIKFRQAARPDCRKRKAPDVEHGVVDIEPGNLKGVYTRTIKEKSSDAIIRFKYEPRVKVPRQKGHVKCSGHLPLGEYHNLAEAQIVYHTACYYYGTGGGCLHLEDGRYKFPIPPMSQEERGLTGKEKRKWVTCTAKQVGKQIYADFQREKGKQLAIATKAGSRGTEYNDPSSSALPLASSSLPMLTTMVDEPAIASAAASAPSLPLLLGDGAVVGDAHDSSEALSGCEDMIAELLHGPESPNLPDPQSSVVSYQMHYQGFAQLHGDPSLPEVGGVAGGIEHDSEPELNPIPSFEQGRVLADAGTENIDGMVFLPQSVPDLQQLLLCQKKCLEDNAKHFVDLDHQLKAYQIQTSRLQQESQIKVSKLQQENEQLRTENESLKSRLEQVAKAQVATWTGIMIDIQQRD